MSTRQSWRSKQPGISHDTPARMRGLTVFAECLAGGLDQCRRMEAVAHYTKLQIHVYFVISFVIYSTVKFVR